jgi:hypothetical protein
MRAGSSSNASAATRATNPGSKKTWSESEQLLQRHRVVPPPAGTTKIEPAGGGTNLLIPSDRTSNSFGVWRKRRSEWCVKGGWKASFGGWSR